MQVPVDPSSRFSVQSGGEEGVGYPDVHWLHPVRIPAYMHACCLPQATYRLWGSYFDLR